MDTNYLLEYLSKNYPQHKDDNVVVWSIDALEDMDITAGYYCAKWEKEIELSDELAFALNDILARNDPTGMSSSNDQAFIALKKWKDERES